MPDHNARPFFEAASGAVEGINNDHRGVGFTETLTGRRGFAWSPGQVSLQVFRGPRGYDDTWAFDINNASPAQAVGYAAGDNRSRAIVWTVF